MMGDTSVTVGKHKSNDVVCHLTYSFIRFYKCHNLLPRGCFGAMSFIILSNFFLMRLLFSGVLSGESFGCMQRCYVNQTQKKDFFDEREINACFNTFKHINNYICV